MSPGSIEDRRSISRNDFPPGAAGRLVFANGTDIDVTSVDVSRTGFGFVADRACVPGTSIALELPSRKRTLRLCAVIRWCRLSEDGRFIHGVRLLSKLPPTSSQDNEVPYSRCGQVLLDETMARRCLGTGLSCQLPFSLVSASAGAWSPNGVTLFDSNGIKDIPHIEQAICTMRGLLGPNSNCPTTIEECAEDAGPAEIMRLALSLEVLRQFVAIRLQVAPAPQHMVDHMLLSVVAAHKLSYLNGCSGISHLAVPAGLLFSCGHHVLYQVDQEWGKRHEQIGLAVSGSCAQGTCGCSNPHKAAALALVSQPLSSHLVGMHGLLAGAYDSLDAEYADRNDKQVARLALQAHILATATLPHAPDYSVMGELLDNEHDLLAAVRPMLDLTDTEQFNQAIEALRTYLQLDDQSISNSVGDEYMPGNVVYLNNATQSDDPFTELMNTMGIGVTHASPSDTIDIADASVVLFNGSYFKKTDALAYAVERTTSQLAGLKQHIRLVVLNPFMPRCSSQTTNAGFVQRIEVPIPLTLGTLRAALGGRTASVRNMHAAAWPVDADETTAPSGELSEAVGESR